MLLAFVWYRRVLRRAGCAPGPRPAERAGAWTPRAGTTEEPGRWRSPTARVAPGSSGIRRCLGSATALKMSDVVAARDTTLIYIPIWEYVKRRRPGRDRRRWRSLPRGRRRSAGPSHHGHPDSPACWRSFPPVLPDIIMFIGHPIADPAALRQYVVSFSLLFGDECRPNKSHTAEAVWVSFHSIPGLPRRWSVEVLKGP